MSDRDDLIAKARTWERDWGERRTSGLITALADLAESEGRRADEAEKKLAEARIRNHGPAMLYLAEEHVSIRKAIGLPGDCEPDVIVEHFERIVAERDAALAELAALKGQQP